MIKKLAFNPYMPSYEYVPDGEPHIFGDRVYVYGSHDRFNGLNFCLNDYVCYSAPINDLGSWRYEGIIYRRSQDPKAPGLKIINTMCAPDVTQGNDGRYYLYYFIGGEKMISVAVCDSPAGKYEFYGFVKYKDGTPIGKKGSPVATIKITPTKEKKLFTTSIDIKGVSPLYFRYNGKGRFSLCSLSFK